MTMVQFYTIECDQNCTGFKPCDLKYEEINPDDLQEFSYSGRFEAFLMLKGKNRENNEIPTIIKVEYCWDSWDFYIDFGWERIYFNYVESTDFGMDYKWTLSEKVKRELASHIPILNNYQSEIIVFNFTPEDYAIWSRSSKNIQDIDLIYLRREFDLGKITKSVLLEELKKIIDDTII